MRNPLAIILLMLCCASVQAQHWLGASASVDLAWQLDNIRITTSKIGAGGRLGFVYQWQREHFLLETGIEGEFTYNKLGVADSVLSFNMIDTKGQNFTYIGYLKDRNDISKTLNASIPILVGAEFDYIYFMGGVRLNANLFGKSQQTAQLATVGDYDTYYEILHDMPNHGFHDYEKMQTNGLIKYNWDVRACLEVGANVLSLQNSNRKYHIGLFAEYGILNANKSASDIELIHPDLTEYMQLQLNHIYTSNYAIESSVHNLFVGIRCSILFNVGGDSSGYSKSRRKSQPCHCLPNETPPSRIRPSFKQIK